MATRGLIVPGAGAGRKQVPLKPGHSLMHWVQKNKKEGRRIAGLPPGVMPGPITLDELAKHNTEADCWMAIQGRVYNVTPYMHYHPGGVAELMRGAGQDATALFAEVHSWVNFEGFLEKCLVGYLVDPRKASRRTSAMLKVPQTKVTVPSGSQKMSTAKVTKKRVPLGPGVQPLHKDKSETPKEDSGHMITNTRQPLPKRDWYQSELDVKLVLYKVLESGNLSDVNLFVEENSVHLSITMKSGQYRLLVALENGIEGSPKLSVSAGSTLTITFKKSTGIRWVSLGQVLVETISPLNDRFEFEVCVLGGVDRISANTRIYTFVPTVSEDSWMFGLGQHVMVKAEFSPGNTITRSYTPIESNVSMQQNGISSKCAFRLLVKTYADGNMSLLFNNLHIGDTLQISRPIGNIKVDLESFTDFGMIAGGTGIAPMIPTIDWAVRNQNRKCSLIYSNKSEGDILLKDKFDDLQRKVNFRVHYTLTTPHSEWTGFKGRITSSLLQNSLGPPSPRMIVLVCGGPAFVMDMVQLLKQFGYKYYAFS